MARRRDGHGIRSGRSRWPRSIRAGALKGFVVSGRWPDSTKEWAQLLMVAVRVASLPGLLSTTTIFGVTRGAARRTRSRAPSAWCSPRAPVVGESAVPPGYFAEQQPPALLMLHPPSETMPSLPECSGAASGCVLLPGLPHLGLEHRAAWVEAESDGTVTSMVSRVGRRPDQPPRHRDTGHAACRIRVFEARTLQIRCPERSNSGTRTVVPAGVVRANRRYRRCSQRRGVAPNRRVDILATARPTNREGGGRDLRPNVDGS